MAFLKSIHRSAALDEVQSYYAILIRRRIHGPNGLYPMQVSSDKLVSAGKE
jgi:hypothetical protein